MCFWAFLATCAVFNIQRFVLLWTFYFSPATATPLMGSGASQAHLSCVSRKLDHVVGILAGSWVSRVKSSGLSTNPCGAPVLSMMVLEVLLPAHKSFSLSDKKSSKKKGKIVKFLLSVNYFFLCNHIYNSWNFESSFNVWNFNQNLGKIQLF